MDFPPLTTTETSSSATGATCAYDRVRLQMPAALQLWVHVHMETEISRVLPNPDGGQKRRLKEAEGRIVHRARDNHHTQLVSKAHTDLTQMYSN